MKQVLSDCSMEIPAWETHPKANKAQNENQRLEDNISWEDLLTISCPETCIVKIYWIQMHHKY